MHPASAAPLFSAATALPESDPKLIPEMFTTDSGRNARLRPRAAPSTLAHGMNASCPTWGLDAGTAPPNVRCFTIT